MTKVSDLIDRFGSAERVFAWAEQTDTDLMSEFDLTDEDFTRLLRLAEAP